MPTADDTHPVRFILLGSARSGSNLVAWSLQEHGAIEMFGEIFHDAEGEARTDLPPEVPAYRDSEDGARFLEREVFGRDAGPTKRARGFKIFYDHARTTDAARTAWTYLMRDRDIKVIHLRRRNLFDALVSLEVAMRTGEWFREIGATGAPPAVAPFHLSAWDCQDYFAQTTVRCLWAVSAFRGHECLNLDYDTDLLGDFAGAMARIFDFLGVEPLVVAPLLIRQRQTEPSQQIVNYQDLKCWFKHTLFEAFFEPSDPIE